MSSSGKGIEQEPNGDPFFIEFPSTWLVKKQVLGAPSEASEIQLVEKSSWKVILPSATGFASMRVIVWVKRKQGGS